MCLRFAFLLITRTASWLRLSRREEAWQSAEILILRHQLAVLQRRQPRRLNLHWADRALLATLLGVIPKARRQGLRLLVTPDTILRWHRCLGGRKVSGTHPDHRTKGAFRAGNEPCPSRCAGLRSHADNIPLIARCRVATAATISLTGPAAAAILSSSLRTRDLSGCSWSSSAETSPTTA
jgi:hypothetical protein